LVVFRYGVRLGTASSKALGGSRSLSDISSLASLTRIGVAETTELNASRLALSVHQGWLLIHRTKRGRVTVI